MNESENTSKKTIFDRIKNNKKVQYVIAIILTIIVIFLCFNTYNGSETQIETQAIDKYVDELETKLSNTLSKVDGVGEVAVVITIESGMETILATKTTVSENSNGKETVETPIIVNGKTVILKELYPKIVGVLIVAEGANRISVVSNIQQATVSLLDVNVNQIEILTMK